MKKKTLVRGYAVGDHIEATTGFQGADISGIIKKLSESGMVTVMGKSQFSSSKKREWRFRLF